MRNVVRDFITGAVFGILIGLALHFLTGCVVKTVHPVEVNVECKTVIIGNDQNNRYERICTEK